MSYWGTTKPIIKYGSSYGSTWNLETDDVNCYYDPKWVKDRIFQKSDVNGHIEVVDRSDDDTKGRMYLDIDFHDLTTAQVETFKSMVSDETLKIQLHSNSPNAWEEIFVVKKYELFSSGENYPLKDTGLLELESQDYVINKNDTPT